MTEWHLLRIGDAERLRAAEALGEHFAVGRLTDEEHAERLDRVWAARTHADLAPLFHDLPAPHPVPAVAQWRPGPAPARRPAGRPQNGAPGGWLRRLPGPLLVLLVVLAVVTVLANLPWVLLGLGIWALCATKHRAGPAERHGHRGSGPGSAAGFGWDGHPHQPHRR